MLYPKYDWFQGFCFPDPAFSLYFWNGEDRDYLLKRYHTLKAIDEYWWTYRDSDHDGCLETWCICDTGEDHCTRFFHAPGFWGGEEPPVGVAKLPYESMDYMAYSYETRKTLAAISGILDNGEAPDWEQKAEAVRKKLREYLWIESKNACYDRDCHNEFMDILLHNNIRVMDHGAFDQEMADRFIAHHMLNPEEFWTPMPLPSIAVNDAFFRNNDDNDWSGQPEGLTYQRAIRAIENYGHYAELTMIGKKPMEAAGEEGATASAVIGPNEVFVWRDGALHLDAKSPFAADEALLNEWRKPLPRQ